VSALWQNPAFILRFAVASFCWRPERSEVSRNPRLSTALRTIPPRNSTVVALPTHPKPGISNQSSSRSHREQRSGENLLSGAKDPKTCFAVASFCCHPERSEGSRNPRLSTALRTIPPRNSTVVALRTHPKPGISNQSSHSLIVSSAVEKSASLLTPSPSPSPCPFSCRCATYPRVPDPSRTLRWVKCKPPPAH
jgi:hypothetical protein